VDNLQTVTEARLAQMRALEQKATAGPWQAEFSVTEHVKGSPACESACVAQGRVPFRVETKPIEHDWRHLKRGELAEFHAFRDRSVDDVLGANGEHVVCFGHDYDDYGYVSAEDAEFIAAARSFIPDALAYIETLKGENAQLKRMTQRMEWLELEHREALQQHIKDLEAQLAARDAEVARLMEEHAEYLDGYRLAHTGRCGKCGKLLRDAESIALGLGPICRG
jgi:hypothetical protein